MMPKKAKAAKQVPYTLLLKPWMLADLKEVSKEYERTVSGLIREAISQYLEHYGGPRALVRFEKRKKLDQQLGRIYRRHQKAATVDADGRRVLGADAQKAMFDELAAFKAKPRAPKANAK